MGLSPASFKLLPGVACLHLKSLHISWILSLLHSGLLTSGTCFLGHRHLLIPNQPTTRCGLTFSFALSRPVLSQVSTLSPPLIPCCSLCVSSASFLNIKASKRFWSWSLNMPHSLWAILSIFTDSTTTFSVKNTLLPFQVSPSNTRLTFNDL